MFRKPLSKNKAKLVTEKLNKEEMQKKIKQKVTKQLKEYAR